MLDLGVQHPSLVDRLILHVFNRIATGQWAGGQRLTEDELARDFGVSRTPVREAVRRMSQIGLLVVHPRHRAALEVASVTPADLEQISQLRASLECLAMGLAMKRMKPADLQHLRELVDRCEKLLADLSDDTRGAIFTADSRFHLAIAALSGNRYLEETLRRLDVQVLLCRMLLCRPAHKIRKSVRFHRRILAAMAAGDAAAAEQLMRQHITRTLAKS